MNEELVNMNILRIPVPEVRFLGGTPSLNRTDIVKNQENVMTAAAMIEYNLMSYNSTSST
ncbi:MAG: hypothetical protein ACYCT2_01085 [Thermoplasmataceae archaeon]